MQKINKFRLIVSLCLLSCSSVMGSNLIQADEENSKAFALTTVDKVLFDDSLKPIIRLYQPGNIDDIVFNSMTADGHFLAGFKNIEVNRQRRSQGIVYDLIGKGIYRAELLEDYDNTIFIAYGNSMYKYGVGVRDSGKKKFLGNLSYPEQIYLPLSENLDDVRININRKLDKYNVEIVNKLALYRTNQFLRTDSAEALKCSDLLKASGVIGANQSIDYLWPVIRGVNQAETRYVLCGKLTTKHFDNSYISSPFIIVITYK